MDRFQQDVELTQAGQTVVHIEFATARATRLAAEQKAKDDAARAEQVRQQQAQQRVQAEQARQAQLQQEQHLQELNRREQQKSDEDAKIPWTDSATHLMWTKRESGTDIDWQGANSYCSNLQYGGYTGWRLPTVEELQGIYEPYTVGHIVPVRGGIQRVDGWEWSSSKNAFGHPWAYSFYLVKRDAFGTHKDVGRALCVHPAQ